MTWTPWSNLAKRTLAPETAPPRMSVQMHLFPTGKTLLENAAVAELQRASDLRLEQELQSIMEDISKIPQLTKEGVTVDDCGALQPPSGQARAASVEKCVVLRNKASVELKEAKQGQLKLFES